MQKVDVKVYYAEGVSFVALDKDTFFAVSDDGQKRSIVKELPCSHRESSEHMDNQGQTGREARLVIETARKVAQALSPASTEKGA